MARKEKAIKQLFEEATQKRALFKPRPGWGFSSSRPFVVEFSGVPKAGKTTVASMVKHFFRRAGWRVLTPSEGIDVLPERRDDLVLYNLYSSVVYTLSRLFENIDGGAHLVIVQRGLFDAIGWLSVLRKMGEIKEQELAVMESFLTLERLSRLTDLTILFHCDTSKVLEREALNTVIDVEGLAMNKGFLEDISQAFVQVYEKYRARMPIVKIDTTRQFRQDTAMKIISLILKSVDDRYRPQLFNERSG